MDKFSFIGNGDVNAVEELYKQFKQDPSSVDEEWNKFFQGFDFFQSNYGDRLAYLIKDDHSEKEAYEAIILASLIENETALDNEKTLISGVFIRRLNSGMRLQTDPTVIYALGDSYMPPLKKSDLKIDSTECVKEAQVLTPDEDSDNPLLGYIIGLLLLITLLYIISKATRKPGAPF